MATRKERRDYRRQQRSDFELVRESKVIWEHLRMRKQKGKPLAKGNTLAQEEIVALAKGHFKEVRQGDNFCPWLILLSTFMHLPACSEA